MLFYQSSFAKFRLVGPDAETEMQQMCANDVGKPPGRLAYTQVLNRRGGIECDLTVSRLADEIFYIVTGTASRTRDFDWIAKAISPGAKIELEDVTEETAVLSLMGPLARDVLQAVTDDDVSNATLPFGSATNLAVADVTVLGLRVTYVRELGWELHIDRGDAPTVYDALMSAGKELSVSNAGY